MLRRCYDGPTGSIHTVIEWEYRLYIFDIELMGGILVPKAKH